MDNRLAPADWLQEGLRTLAESGSSGLKIGAMAAALKVTRGSFYWHFESLSDFNSQLLDLWRERSTEAVVRANTTQSEPEKLRSLLKRAFASDRRLERAMRAWAADTPEVADVVTSVDARRVDYIAARLRAAGVDRASAKHRAAFLYWAYLGQALVMDPRLGRLSRTGLENISALFEQPLFD